MSEPKSSSVPTPPEPMSYVDYLLSHLAQECCEVAIRCTKAQHFGLDEIQPEQPLTNRQRIQEELCDLFALVDQLQELVGFLGAIIRRASAPNSARQGNFEIIHVNLGG